MRQSAWLKRLVLMVRAKRSLGQAALFLHSRFVEPNKPDRPNRPDRPTSRHAPRNVGVSELAIILGLRLAVMGGLG